MPDQREVIRRSDESRGGSVSRRALALERLGPVLRFMRALWELDHALFSASKRMRSHLGVTGPERLVIRILGEIPDLTPSELAEIMHLDPSTLTGLIGRLVRRRLVSRHSDEQDARKSHLRLTAEGEAVDRVRSGTVEAGVRAALDALPPEDLVTTVAVLAALSRSLDAVSSGARAPAAAPAPRRRRQRQG